MNSFKTPLKKRLHDAAIRKARYWMDSDYRLRLVNEKRIKRGQEPLTSIDQVGADFAAHVASRQRDSKGRYS